jgi:hypothetical protein
VQSDHSRHKEKAFELPFRCCGNGVVVLRRESCTRRPSVRASSALLMRGVTDIRVSTTEPSGDSTSPPLTLNRSGCDADFPIGDSAGENA